MSARTCLASCQLSCHSVIGSAAKGCALVHGDGRVIMCIGSNTRGQSLHAMYNNCLVIVTSRVLLQEKAFHAMAVMDLTLLGVVITRAFTQKSVLLVFVYVNMLRHRYKAQVSAKYHQAVWGVLVSYAQPVLSRMPSPVHTGLGYLTRWFTGSAV